MLASAERVSGSTDGAHRAGMRPARAGRLAANNGGGTITVRGSFRTTPADGALSVPWKRNRLGLRPAFVGHGVSDGGATTARGAGLRFAAAGRRVADGGGGTAAARETFRTTCADGPKHFGLPTGVRRLDIARQREEKRANRVSQAS